MKRTEKPESPQSCSWLGCYLSFCSSAATHAWLRLLSIKITYSSATRMWCSPASMQQDTPHTSAQSEHTEINRVVSSGDVQPMFLCFYENLELRWTDLTHHSLYFHDIYPYLSTFCWFSLWSLFCVGETSWNQSETLSLDSVKSHVYRFILVVEFCETDTTVTHCWST